jgi:site-specific recombinase XerD
MPRICRAPGCDSPTTSRYSVYSSRHQSRLRRQGDVAQKAISKAELKTYLKRVRQRIAKNPDNPASGQLEARWLAVVEHANGVVTQFRVGLPFPVHTHMLRHGCGYALANAGHDTRLGHANIQHTVKYTELAATRFASFWK